MIDYAKQIKKLSDMDLKSPDMAGLDNILVQLTASFSDVGIYRAKCRHEYYKKLAKLREESKTAKEAEIKAGADLVYLLKEEADADWEAVKNTINTIKHLQNQYGEVYKRSA